MRDPNPTVIVNPWQSLRQLTTARIALGRSGVSLPTGAQLAFQLAHAQARDAVHQALDTRALAQALAANGDINCVSLSSAAENRQIYLQRPDLGRRLDAGSRETLQALSDIDASACQMRRHDLALVIADGLSALAIEQNALPFIDALKPRLQTQNWRLAPIIIARQARVAIGDEIGELLGAKVVVVLIGERPGLSSPDSMGLYLTWAPRVGLTDESRNCISNVQPAGLSYEEAAFKLHYLLRQAHERQLSGIRLKDETATIAAHMSKQECNFLLPPE
ncbi:ethanolamine ammonia-lyase subunit EutC [Collimonas sp.]|jgi:ethanolamine ammonia-lyase small subunit|uniref:ethanolamine ammonia-lyase subunit EutC n=1 Tax=Collimonas sp. TaxID=1963772 RepID=UPI0037C059B5